ncbi:MAG: PEGA domain-containing protein [Bradymonadales bacterium]|nr:PEGA domain-containing protein [Bradymonadales bacterium]
MNAKAISLAICLVLVGMQEKASAQGWVITLQTQHDSDLSPGVIEQLDNAIYQGLIAPRTHQVLNEQATRGLLGDQADRLMSCAGDPVCSAELAELTSGQAAVLFSVSETGRIYTFTVDVYRLPDGEGLFFSDSDCPLCTVEEAATQLSRLARSAIAAVPTVQEEEVVSQVPEPLPTIPTPPVVQETEISTPAPTPIGSSLSIRAEPQAAEIYLDQRFLGTGSARTDVPPGTHRLRVSLTGYEPIDELVEVEPGGQDLDIAIRLNRQETPAAPSARRGGWLDGVDTTAWGSVIGGTGIAALVVGAILLAIDGDPSCSDADEATCPEVFDTFGGGVTLTILGTVAVTSGTVLLLWDLLAGSPTASESVSSSSPASLQTELPQWVR